MKVEGGRQAALLISPPLNGTTSVLQMLVEEARPKLGRSVLMTAMPTNCNVTDLMDGILAALPQGPPLNPREPAYAREMRMFLELGAKRPAAIVVDQAEHLLHVPAQQRKRMIDLVLHLGKRSSTPLIIAVPPRLGAMLIETYNLPGQDLFPTLQPIRLARLKVDEGYLDLLDRWEGMLPLERASHLAQRELALHLYALSDGNLGILSTVLRRAATCAIRSGEECITLGLLDRLGCEQAPTFRGFRF